MILEIDNVELSFSNKRILYGVYLKSETGKVTGILGRNGCGKTSLLRILFGSLKSKYKSVRVNCKHQKGRLFGTGLVAYLPQHQMLPHSLKLSKAFRLFDVSWHSFTSDFPAFEVHQKATARELSSGELRVVEIYLILNSGKEIILLDEPFSFIAPLYVEQIKALIRLKKATSSIVITDQFYRDILEVSDNVYLLKNGYSKLIGSREDLENEGYLNVGS